MSTIIQITVSGKSALYTNGVWRGDEEMARAAMEAAARDMDSEKTAHPAPDEPTSEESER